jgi:Ca2+-binding EF-hand superfamily protein
MEVVVEAVASAPADAVLSVTSGGSRRQGALRDGLAFRFPEIPEGACTVDVLQKVGTTTLPVDKLSSGSVTEPLSIADGTEAGIAFTVSVTPLDRRGNPDSTEAKTRHSVAQDGKQYLETNKVFPLVQGLVLDLLLHKPENPAEHIIKTLQEQSAEAGSAFDGGAAMQLLEEAKHWRTAYADIGAKLEQVEAEKAEYEAKVLELQAAVEKLEAQAKTSKADYDRLADAQSALAAVGMAPTPVARTDKKNVSDDEDRRRLSARVNRGMSVVIQTMREHKKQVDEIGFDLLDDWVRQVINGAQFAAVANERFDECDSTGRGFLTPAELQPLLEEIAKGLPFEMHQNHVEEFLSVFDLDQNGLISREEFLNFTKVIFVHVAIGQSGKAQKSAAAA